MSRVNVRFFYFHLLLKYNEVVVIFVGLIPSDKSPKLPFFFLLFSLHGAHRFELEQEFQFFTRRIQAKYVIRPHSRPCHHVPAALGTRLSRLMASWP